MQEIAKNPFDAEVLREVLREVHDSCQYRDDAFNKLKELINQIITFPIEDEALKQIIRKLSYLSDGEGERICDDFEHFGSKRAGEAIFALKVELLIALSKNNREEAQTQLEEMLKEGHIAPISKQKITKIFSLLDNQPRHLTGISSDEAVRQIIETLLDPSTIQQGNGSLCGVDVYMRFLVKHFPEKFVDFSYNLLQEGKTKIPFSIQLGGDKPETRKCLLPTMMEAVKNTENTMGYHPDRLLDPFFGTTLPKEIYKWIKKTGGNVEYESLKIVDKNFEEFPTFWRKVWGKGGFYSEIHDYTSNNQIENVQNAIQEGKFCIGLISSQVERELVFYEEGSCRGSVVNEQELNDEDIEMLLGAQLGHYVHILNIEDKVRKKNLPPKVCIADKKGYPHENEFNWNPFGGMMGIERERRVKKPGEYYLTSIDGEWNVVFYEGTGIKREFPASEVEGLAQLLENKNHPKRSYKFDPNEPFDYAPICVCDNSPSACNQDPGKLTEEDHKEIERLIKLHHNEHYLNNDEKLDIEVDGVELTLETSGHKYKIHLTNEAFLKHFTGIMIAGGSQPLLEEEAEEKRQKMKVFFSEKVKNCCTDEDQIKIRNRLDSLLDDYDRPATEVMEEFTKTVKENSESLPLKIVKLIFCILCPALLFFGNPLGRSVCDEVADFEKSCANNL